MQGIKKGHSESLSEQEDGRWFAYLLNGVFGAVMKSVRPVMEGLGYQPEEFVSNSGISWEQGIEDVGVGRIIELGLNFMRKALDACVAS
jgi:hypothetical protein